MSRMNEYRFYTTDLLTGVIRDEVELSSFTWTDLYRRPGSATGTARLEAATTTRANFEPWQTALWAVKGNSIRYGGLIGAVQPRSGSRVINIPVHGFLEYFRTRQLRSAQGMSYGTLTNITDITWSSIDQFQVAKDLIDHAQSFDNGNIGFNVVWDALSGREINLTYRTYNYKYVGIALEQLADRLNGFDFKTRYYWDSGEPKAELYLNYPSQARRTNWLFAFDTERPVLVDTITQYAVEFPNESGSYLKAPDEGMLTLDGDLEVQSIFAMDDWTDTTSTIIGRWIETGNKRSFRVDMLATGAIRFYWSPDGSTVESIDSSATHSFVNGEYYGIKVEFDVDNGAAGRTAKFYTSDDSGSTWVQLGSDVTEAGVTSIYTSTEDFMIGAYNTGGTTGIWPGKLLWAQIRKGIGGAISSWFDARNFVNTLQTEFVDVRGNEWSLESNVAVVAYTTVAETSTQSVARNSNITQYDLDGGNKPVTGVAVIGEGEADDMVRVFVDDPNTSLPLYEATRSYKEVSNPTTLTEHGLSYLNYRKIVRPQISLKLDQNLEPSYTEYDVGDEVSVRIRDGFVQEDGLFVVGSKRVVLSKQQDEHVEIEVVTL